MNNKELFKQAIAEAKTIREMALDNAKKALEESLSPKIQSMLETQLQGIEESEDLDENQDTDLNETTDLDEELNLDEILAEIELDEVELDETKDEDKKDDKKDDKESKPKSSSTPSTSTPSEPKEEKVTGLSVEDLKALITDIVTTAVSGGAEAPTDDLGLGDDAGLDGGLDDGTEFGADDLGANDDLGLGDDLGGGEEEFDLDEMLAELDALDESSAELDETKDAELEEAVKTIQELRSQLSEVNLMNAKLIYVNRIFKAVNLNESQKLKVIDAFDKATNVKEAKLVFESMKSNISKPKKSPIKENLGFASKATGATGKKIVENEAITRMQFLAGIKK